jgi:hypothetical protein
MMYWIVTEGLRLVTLSVVEASNKRCCFTLQMHLRAFRGQACIGARAHTNMRMRRGGWEVAEASQGICVLKVARRPTFAKKCEFMTVEVVPGRVSLTL